jgi:hypothetical protein
MEAHLLEAEFDSDRMAGTPAALASATTHPSAAGASPAVAASSVGIVTASGFPQSLSGYRCTPTVFMCTCEMTRGSWWDQWLAVASSGPITGKASTAGCKLPATCRYRFTASTSL